VSLWPIVVHALEAKPSPSGTYDSAQRVQRRLWIVRYAR